MDCEDVTLVSEELRWPFFTIISLFIHQMTYLLNNENKRCGGADFNFLQVSGDLHVKQRSS